MRSAKELLNIDAKETSGRIENHIRHIVAEGLDLNLNVGSIDAVMREKEKNAAFFKFISTLPPFVLPFISSLYYIIVGETPYMTTLRKEDLKKSKFRRWIYDNIVNGLESMFDGPCTVRRVVLEKIAQEQNLLVIGSGNRSEDLTGWFTIDGVDNMPHSPIMGLFKTQVRQLAEHLDIPGVIQKRAPSPDVLKGADDALALGMSFDKIDIILHGIENNMSDYELMEYGLTKNQIARVRKIHKMSAWKRTDRK